MSVKIKKSEFQKLYNIACGTWQKKFTEKFKDFLFQEELEFDKEFLVEMRQACTEEQLRVFNEIFQDFKEKDWTKVINSFSDICKYLGEKELSMEDFKFLPEKQRRSAYGKYRLELLTTLCNNGVKVDFSNRNQEKFYNWFENKNGKWVFCTVGGSAYFSDCSVGHYFLEEKYTKWAADKFYDIYLDILSQ